MSQSSDVVSGVPQGTVLGPILFSIYINDIVSVVNSDIRLFADDCVCYREIKSSDDCYKLQRDIDSLGSWARSWGMRFQPIKCNMMQISRKAKNIDFRYKLEGTDLSLVDSVKYLGVHITKDLSWNKHVNAICTKANRTLGLLRRNLSKCPSEVKMQAYKGLVRPILEYACPIWDPHAAYLEDQLERVQKRSARFIASDYNYEPGSMTNILKKLQLPALKLRRRQNRLILLFKGLHSKAHIPTENMKGPIRRTRKMHNLHFNQIYASTDTYKYSFIPKTVRDWNQISQSILDSATLANDPVTKFSELVRLHNTI